MSHLIEIEGLTKRFGLLEAVKGISFTVDRGEVLGFLGPNGAGKSTTMKMLAGFLTPTTGTAKICGFDVVDNARAAKVRLGYLPEGAPAYPDMTVAAFLRFVARIRGYRGPALAAQVEAAADRVDLASVLSQPIETLSKGFRRRVGLAQALLHDPEVLILDEPTDGLDPNQKHQVRTLIEGMAATKAIIISTHILEEVEAVCTRAMIIAGGQILADSTPAELEARSPFHRALYVRAETRFPKAALMDVVALPEVRSLEGTGRSNDQGLVVMPRDGAELLAPVRQVMDRHGVALAEIRIERGRLDGVFRDITLNG